MANNKYIGQRVVREDSLKRATGETRYVADMKRRGMLYAKLLRSSKAHADFTLDLKKALEVPGVEAIYTYEDIPKVAYNSMKWYPGIEAIEDEYLLSNRARYFGDRLALVVANSVETAELARDLIKVDYTPRDTILTIEDAKTKKEIVHGTSNLSFEKSISCGDFEESKRAAYLSVQTKGKTPKLHHAAIEPHVCLSEIDDFGNLVIWSPCQVVFQIRMHIADILGLEYNKIRVIKAAMGGSFGGKSIPILEPICAFATMKLKRPVMLSMDRREVIIGSVVGNNIDIEVETTVDQQGHILGRRFDVDVDGGAYDTNSAAVTNAFAKKIFRLYNIPNQSFVGRAYYTNTTPSGAYRAYGSPQAHAMAEVNIDQICKKLSMDPCDFRLKNLVTRESVDLSGGTSIGNAQVRECVELGRQKFDWDHKRKTIREKNTNRYAYGVGMACATHVNGYTGPYPDFTNVYIELNMDGTVVVKVAAHEQGCGTITTLSQIAAEAIGVELHQITVTEADTFITPQDSAGTQASRVTFVSGKAVQVAGEKFRKRLFESAAEIFDVPEEAIYLEDGSIRCHQIPNLSMDLSTFETTCRKKLSRGIAIFSEHIPTTNPASFGAFFCEVKVDRFTGHVEILRALAVHDVGQSINPQLVEGQIQGGAHFSLGMALGEEILHNSKGVVTNATLAKYHMLNACDMPYVEAYMIEEGGDEGPYGAKSIGEAAAIAPAPAVLNAINFALDTDISIFPATPERIVDALLIKENTK